MSGYSRFLKNISFFSSLSHEDIGKLESVCSEKRFGEGTVIFRESSSGDSFFIILEGTVEIWLHYGDADQDLLTLYGPGQSFGELAIIDDSPRSATAVAHEDVRLLSISRESFKKAISVSNPISLSIMKSVSAMVRRSNESLIENMRAKNRHLERAYAQLKNESKERRRAEEALRESSRRLCSILDSMPDIISELDKDMRIRWANKAALERNPDIMDKFCYRACWEKDEPCEGCPAIVSLKTGNIETATVHHPNPISSQEDAYWENIAIPLKDSRKAITGVLVVSRNITLRMRLEEEVRHAQKMKAVATLAGCMAHEFNNLLMCIQGNVSLMMATTDSSDPRYHRLSNIEKNVQTGADITKKLLGISNRKKFRIEKTDMNHLIRKTAETFENNRKNIRFRGNYAQNLWDVEAEPGQISKVFSGLILNACRAMPQGGDICLKTENVILNPGDFRKARLKNGRYVSISLADTDVSMEPNARQEIFDPFFAASAVGSGTDLSLAEAYSIIDDHGGAIYLYGEKGKGSKFEVLLPAHITSNSRSAETAPSMPDARNPGLRSI